MNYSQHIHGIGPATSENAFESETNTARCGLDWRIYTNPAARRNLRYDKSARAAFGYAWVDRFVENTRHRGTLDQLQ
jgi:hypothetical protein